MPDGEYKYILQEINRKLSLAKIASSHKGKELIDDVLENDLPKLIKIIRELKNED